MTRKQIGMGREWGDAEGAFSVVWDTFVHFSLPEKWHEQLQTKTRGHLTTA